MPEWLRAITRVNGATRKPMFDTLLASPMRLGETLPQPIAHELALEAPAYTEYRLRRAEPSNILVGLLLPIGDTLLATPALAALRQRFPRATITAMVSRSNAGILEDNPNVDRLVFVTSRGSEGALWRFARGLSEIRQIKYDLIVKLSPASSIVLWMAGQYKKQLRLDMPAFWWLIGGHSRTYRARHAIDHYLQALTPILDWPLTDEDRQPRLYLTAHDRSSARRLLRDWGLSPANLLIAMHAGGDGFSGRKRWAPRRFAAVANHLIQQFHAHVLLVGGKADIPLSEEVAALIPQGATVIAGRTSLKETAALIEASALFIGNDSSPLHIAAAVGTPAVGVFGPSDHEQFRPVGRRNYRQRVIHSDLPCSPCFHFLGNDAPWTPNTCYSRACLKAIQPEQVIEAAIELLDDRRED